MTTELFEAGLAITRFGDSQDLVVRRRDHPARGGAEELRVAVDQERIEPDDPDRSQATQVIGQGFGPSQSSVKVIDLGHGEHRDQPSTCDHPHLPQGAYIARAVEKGNNPSSRASQTDRGERHLAAVSRALRTLKIITGLVLRLAARRDSSRLLILRTAIGTTLTVRTRWCREHRSPDDHGDRPAG